MVTTIRTTKKENEIENNSARGGVGVLDRKTPQSFSAYKTQVNSEDMAVAKKRMQENLARLLNYDKPSNNISCSTQTIERPQQKVIERPIEKSSTTLKGDEDIRPTSTTMQFGDDSIGQMYNDIKREKEQEKSNLRLNKKGKILVALYAVTVVIIMALIVLNTGILSVLSESTVSKRIKLTQKMEELSQITSEIDAISSDDYVLNIAENEYGMIRG